MDGQEHLWSVEREVFSGLSSLQHLSMRYNKDLRSLPEGLLSPLTSVQSIDMTGSGLIHLHETAFSGMPQLSQVSLAGN